jgi:hypothetical protein
MNKMRLSDVTQILHYLAIVDNRNVSDSAAEVWHEIIGHLDFETAKEASLLARQDPAISWIEPRHILAKARQVKETQLTNQRRETAQTLPSEKPGQPMPKCKHGRGLLYCGPCCHQIAVDAGTIPNRPYRAK